MFPLAAVAVSDHFLLYGSFSWLSRRASCFSSKLLDGGLCCVRWNQVLSSLRARDRYFSFVESSEFLLHARVWYGFWLLVDLWLDTVVLAFFLFRACESRKMCVDTWLDQYLLLWDLYPGNLIICLDFATRSFFGRRLEFIATIIFRRFFVCFSFALNPSTSIDHLLFRPSSGSLDVTVGV